MGVDLYGTNGEYFRNNWWWWRPLAAYCFEVAPVCKRSNHFRQWSTNDGSMTAEEAQELAGNLQAQIDSGATKLYQRARQARLEAMPDESCELCNGTGRRSPMDDIKRDREALKLVESLGPEVGIDDDLKRIMREQYIKRALADPTPVECVRCHGYKSHRPRETEYPFEVENVQNFVKFLETCGGFEVH